MLGGGIALTIIICMAVVVILERYNNSPFKSIKGLNDNIPLKERERLKNEIREVLEGYRVRNISIFKLDTTGENIAIIDISMRVTPFAITTTALTNSVEVLQRKVNHIIKADIHIIAETEENPYKTICYYSHDGIFINKD